MASEDKKVENEGKKDENLDDKVVKNDQEIKNKEEESNKLEKEEKSTKKKREKSVVVNEYLDISGVCRCPNKQVCICNYNMILQSLLEYDRIYDNPKIPEKVPWKKIEVERKSSEPTCKCIDHKVCICENYMVNINFYMMHKLIFTKRYSYRTLISQLKYDLSNLLKLPVECLQILRWHVFLNDSKPIEYLHPIPGEEIDLVVINTSSTIPTILQDNIVPDIITVQIENDHVFKEVTVEIEDRKISKPFFGGYRHKESEIEYHHASTQSGPPDPTVEPYNKNHRDTQTILLKNRLIQQSYSRATQMTNENTFIPTVTDKILLPKKYETAEELETRLDFLRKVKTIQRYYRSWKIRKQLKILHQKYLKTAKNMAEEEKEVKDENDMQKIREINAKTFPRTREDFGMLYSMVDRWKKAQIERISRNCSGAAKLAEFYLLLNKEIEMLASIEKHRQRLKKEMKDIEMIRFFKFISDPIRWKGYKGLNVSMDTIETQKGREYKHIFYDACNHQQPPEDRLEFIRNLRDSLKNHICATSLQLVELLNREEELIIHQVDETSLDILRKRIEQLLLKHMKLPECNEGVTRRMTKLQQKDYENNSNYCARCNKIKSNKEFPPINSRNLAIKSCMSCTWYDRVQEPWYEIAPYRLILRQIRRDERKRNNFTSIAYIIQEKDIHYIIQRIWHARSIINESTNLNELRLCRWKRNEEWSPWNTILLTEKEVECHLKIAVLEDIYDEDFRIAVMDKNLLGRVVFSNALFLKDQFVKDKSFTGCSSNAGSINDGSIADAMVDD